MTKHAGIGSNRLQDNPREVEFARNWQRENDLVDTLAKLLSPIEANSRIPRTLIPRPSQRDIAVAATVIQWLGSNVGMEFLRQVIQSSPEIQRRFKVL
jgi:hypothetical protein